MEKSASPIESNSSSSKPMDESSHSDAVLALGRKIVEQLNLATSVNTLGRWMSHYIAELICKCESVETEHKADVQKECFDTILALWKHRSELPNGTRPFEDLEPITRAIESVDPEGKPRYFRPARPSDFPVDDESEAKKWLELADALDYSAKLLISDCLAQAAHEIRDKDKEWVKWVELAEAARIEDGPFESVTRFVKYNYELGEKLDRDRERLRKIDERQKGLKAFIDLATAWMTELTSQTEQLENNLEEKLSHS